MGLEEFRVIQEFVAEHGWAPCSKIAFNQYGNGYFEARWGDDIAYISMTVDGMLLVAAKESMHNNPKAIFKCSLADPKCLEKFSLALRLLWD